MFFCLAERFGFTPEQVAELTIDSALILLTEGKDPTRKTMTIRPGESSKKAIEKLKGESWRA